jgi:hypothetical protein
MEEVVQGGKEQGVPLAQQEVQPGPMDDSSATSTESRRNPARSTRNSDAVRASSRSQVQVVRPKTRKDLAGELFAMIQKEKGKFFIICRDRPAFDLKDWHVVQVHMDDTDIGRAKTRGYYQVRFWVRTREDAKVKKVRECRHWPLLHKIHQRGRRVSMITPANPDNLNRMLNVVPVEHIWKQTEINLLDDMVVGPFDLEKYIVPKQVWEELKGKAERRKIYTTNVDSIVKLEGRDWNDKDRKGNPSSMRDSSLWELDDTYLS